MGVNTLSVPHDVATHYHNIWDLKVVTWEHYPMDVNQVVSYAAKDTSYPYIYVPVIRTSTAQCCAYQIAGVVTKEVPARGNGFGIVRLAGPVQLRYNDSAGIEKGDWLTYSLVRAAVQASSSTITTITRKRFAYAMEAGAAGSGLIWAMMVPWRL